MLFRTFSIVDLLSLQPKIMSPSKHATPLMSHLHEPRLWWDFFVLALIWALTITLDDQSRVFGISVATVLKIMGMVGLLETFSFIVFHWLGYARGVLLQGFLGGFMSSTTVFIQLTQADTVKLLPPTILSRALLLATLAMIIECVFILYAIAPPTRFLLYSLPFLVQGACIAVAVMLFPKVSNEAQVLNLDILSNHPISWSKVMRFSVFIIALIWGIRWFNQSMQLSLVWSGFLLSLFEAHAVLAASMIELSPSSPDILSLQIIIAVVLGNTLSKCFFVARTKNRTLTVYVAGILIASALVVVAAYFFVTT